MNYVGAHHRAAEAMHTVGVVVEVDLQRDEAVPAQLHRLDRPTLLVVPNVQAAAVFQKATSLRSKPGTKGLGAAHSEPTITL